MQTVRRMAATEQLPEGIQKALDKGVEKRLPLTFLPFVNEQLHKWEFLFPNERQSTERLLVFVDSLSPAASTVLFRDVVGLEEKMGVRRWQFSTAEQTILNSSQLARSAYFQEWRAAVQAVFDAADKHAAEQNPGSAKPRNRLVLLNLPRRLAVKPTVWQRWQGIGTVIDLDLRAMPPDRTSLEVLLAGEPGNNATGWMNAFLSRSATADAWVVDAEKSLVNALLLSVPKMMHDPASVLLSYGRLDAYRTSFSREMNTMRKDLADADAVFDRLRKVNVTPWCPPEVEASAAVREYVRGLYLSGNGAVIFGNSFVEWGASEAFRRARPAFLAAQFGVRAKPKAFTGVAIFDNPDWVNPAPSVDDLPGSAEDAAMLSLYVWLAAMRYSEYQSHTACLCIAESFSQAYLIAPADFPLLSEDEGPLPLSRLAEALRDWFGSTPEETNGG